MTMPDNILAADPRQVAKLSEAMTIAVDQINSALNGLQDAGMSVPDIMQAMTLIYGQVLYAGGMVRDVLVPLEQHPIGATIVRGYDYMAIASAIHAGSTAIN